MPMRGMNVPFVSHGCQVPAHALALIHHQSRQVGEDISIQRMVQSVFAIPDFFTFLQLVKDHEQSDELSIDVNRRAIWFSASARSDDDWPDQTAICLHGLIDMAVIKPHTRAFAGG